MKLSSFRDFAERASSGLMDVRVGNRAGNADPDTQGIAGQIGDWHVFDVDHLEAIGGKTEVPRLRSGRKSRHAAIV